MKERGTKKKNRMVEQVRRGEVYWAQNDVLGVDQKLGRPIVIVSSDVGNERSPQVIGLFTTTTPRYGVLNVELTSSPNKRSWVQCNYFYTMHKEKLGNYMFTLSEDEMADVERGMRVALSLGLSESESEDDEEEKRELEEEIEALRTRLKTRDDDKLGVIVERDMWKKMYEKALDELASLKVKRDVAEPKPVPVYEAKVDEPKPKPEEKLVEINTCTEADLRNIGCTLTMIHNIIEKRPYKAVTDLKVVPGITRVAYQIIEKKVCCVPVVKPKPAKVEPAKVNVNTATANEIMSGLGIGKFYAYLITGHRNKNGNYGSLEDLLSVQRIPSDFLERYGDKLTV